MDEKQIHQQKSYRDSPSEEPSSITFRVVYGPEGHIGIVLNGVPRRTKKQTIRLLFGNAEDQPRYQALLDTNKCITEIEWSLSTLDAYLETQEPRDLAAHLIVVVDKPLDLGRYESKKLSCLKEQPCWIIYQTLPITRQESSESRQLLEQFNTFIKPFQTAIYICPSQKDQLQALTKILGFIHEGVKSIYVTISIPKRVNPVLISRGGGTLAATGKSAPLNASNYKTVHFYWPLLPKDYSSAVLFQMDNCTDDHLNIGLITLTIGNGATAGQICTDAFSCSDEKLQELTKQNGENWWDFAALALVSQKFRYGEKGPMCSKVSLDETMDKLNPHTLDRIMTVTNSYTRILTSLGVRSHWSMVLFDYFLTTGHGNPEILAPSTSV